MLLAAFIIVIIQLFAPWNEGTLYPITPRIKFICLTTLFEVLQAKMGCFGRYFETNLAILPVIVIRIIKSIFKPKAAWAQAAARSSLVRTGSGE